MYARLNLFLFVVVLDHVINVGIYPFSTLFCDRFRSRHLMFDITNVAFFFVVVLSHSNFAWVCLRDFEVFKMYLDFLTVCILFSLSINVLSKSISSVYGDLCGLQFF